MFEKFTSGEKITDTDIAEHILSREIFPCFFGSGLKLSGVSSLIEALERYSVEKKYPEHDMEFSAKVYKISYENEIRFTHLKITGGTLSSRQAIKYTVPGSSEILEEKITLIRKYSGNKFETPASVEAGELCAVSGLSKTYSGQGIGHEKDAVSPYIEPVLRYKILLPTNTDAKTFFPKLRALEDEEPLLRIFFNEYTSEIHAHIMEQMQIEILEQLILDKYNLSVRFTGEQIIYKETLSEPAEGIGHFEPLRHYAEVHLKIEPLPVGTGIEFDTAASARMLETNYQKNVLSYLQEKQITGVLTDSPLTDVKITLTAGKSHLKHTQGGDFREATYRALRHGMMCAKERSAVTLLEPYYAFKAEVPKESAGRIISDILEKSGQIKEHILTDETSTVSGTVPVSEMFGYNQELASYTHGRGKITYYIHGYFPCHNTENIVNSIKYIAENDKQKTADSVFCAHGTGIIVNWRDVEKYMHIIEKKHDTKEIDSGKSYFHNTVSIDERELKEILERKFLVPKAKKNFQNSKKEITHDHARLEFKSKLYIVDGYNIIFTWDELASIAKEDLDHSRTILCEILANFKAFTGCDVIVVFDAYRVKTTAKRKFDENGVHVVYTKENEFADMYIEKLITEIGRNFSVRVVSSDALIQLKALHTGAVRMSAGEFKNDIEMTEGEINNIISSLKKEMRKKMTIGNSLENKEGKIENESPKEPMS